ncbi:MULTISPECIES: hypothetical protein [Actinobacillus]|uniref:Phage protein n=2 Tax=Actinobacillus suis TaxID=716 RepID=K0GAK9_ACTSU|nr:MULTISPECIES: hypothetical protein [Actinobacillus]AFU18690.1 hypothetical protein ASU2_02740 [Actinobacillus suis H91-0380]EFM95292.1 hypothetical protein appser10_21520 [Actinobacillus pleuropneumoniae serovar 10 str. D13039]MCO4169197.1 hypothetical protein [Actinobacillus suis]MCQ9629801.1 hypothetical protein [Actinobacillus suis]MCQ9711946.1 hypothetical protein [Actinobacillus suis]
MSKKTTPVQGTKFYVGVGLEATKKITACTVETPTITVASSGLAAGDCIFISGLGGMDGYYPVKAVADSLITLADEVSWKRFDLPKDFSKATIAKVQYSDQWCTLTSIESEGDSLGEEDVTTICDEGKVTEPGEIEFGALNFKFYYKPSDKMQSVLRGKFYNKETFPYKCVFPNKEGALYGSGFIQTSAGFSGEVLAKFDSNVKIKKSTRDYLLITA